MPRRARAKLSFFQPPSSPAARRAKQAAASELVEKAEDVRQRVGVEVSQRGWGEEEEEEGKVVVAGGWMCC